MQFRALAAGIAMLAAASAPLVPAQAPAQAQQRAPAAAPAAQGQAQGQPAFRVPDNATLLILVRSTLEALNQANRTENYSVLYLLGSDNFRRTNTPQGLSQAFAPFRTNRVTLYPALVLTPQLTRAPAIENGALHIVGVVPSRPSQINFDLRFEPSQGILKLSAMNVTLSRAAQPAQQGQQPQGQQPRPQQPQQAPRKP